MQRRIALALILGILLVLGGAPATAQVVPGGVVVTRGSAYNADSLIRPGAVIGQVCPGDGFVLYQRIRVNESALWLRIELLIVGEACSSRHIPVGTVAYVDSRLVQLVESVPANPQPAPQPTAAPAPPAPQPTGLPQPTTAPAPTSQPAVTPTASRTAAPTATTAPTNTPVASGVTVTQAPGTVRRGAMATVAAHTAPGVRCTIVVDYKSGPSTAAGLEPKVTDGNGNVSWTWKVGTRTTPGTWPITITCGNASTTTAITVV